MSELIPFKDKYLNEKIVLFAPGPTFNDFSYEKYPELKGVKKCALNGSILDDRFSNIRVHILRHVRIFSNILLYCTRASM